MKRVSVVIVTYRSEKDIYDCLASLFKWADIPREELEVIVVDNNSPEADRMFNGIRRIYGDEIVLVNNTNNGGYGQGNNVGIRRAKAPVIMIMNPDVRLNSHVFNHALSIFAQKQYVGIYGLTQMISENRKCGTSFNTTHMMNGYLRILLTGISNRFNIFLPSCMYLGLAFSSVVIHLKRQGCLMKVYLCMARKTMFGIECAESAKRQCSMLHRHTSILRKNARPMLITNSRCYAP